MSTFPKAADVPFTPSGDLTATDVQGAITEAAGLGGGGTGGLILDNTQTGDLVAGTYWPADVQSQVRTRNMPATANDNDRIAVRDRYGNAGTYTITLTPQGATKIDGVNEAFTITVAYGEVEFVYESANNDWIIVRT